MSSSPALEFVLSTQARCLYSNNTKHYAPEVECSNPCAKRAVFMFAWMADRDSVQSSIVQLETIPLLLPTFSGSPRSFP